MIYSQNIAMSVLYLTFLHSIIYNNKEGIEKRIVFFLLLDENAIVNGF